jgi:hypothetical protein
VCDPNRYDATCQQAFIPYTLLLLPLSASVLLLTFKVNLRCVATYKIELYTTMTLKKTIKAWCEGLSRYSSGEAELEYVNLNNYRRLCGRYWNSVSACLLNKPWSSVSREGEGSFGGLWHLVQKTICSFVLRRRYGWRSWVSNLTKMSATGEEWINF